LYWSINGESTSEELKKHYEFMLSSAKSNLSGYIQSGVISGKHWMAGRDKHELVAKHISQNMIEAKSLGYFSITSAPKEDG